MSAKNTHTSLSRRQLLSKNKALPYRPPWAVDEYLFDDICTNCGECIKHCPTHILSFGRGRLPVVDFSHNECTFCGQCERVCVPNALHALADTPPWNIVVQVNNTCLATNKIICRSCEDNCDYQAIQFRLSVGGQSTPIISNEKCTGCGACIAPCPNQSIQIINHINN